MSNVGYDTWWDKAQSCTVFVVKNIAKERKTIKLFQIPIMHNKEYDLLSIRWVSESDIRHSLLKGELQKKFKAGEFRVLLSNIDLLQFDQCQLQFLESMGITTGLQVSGTGDLPVNFKESILLLGAKDNNNRVFTIPAPDKFINGIFQNNEFRIQVRHNGKLLEENIDYVVMESGGTGTGFDTIILTFSPKPRSRLLADYVVEKN